MGSCLIFLNHQINILFYSQRKLLKVKQEDIMVYHSLSESTGLGLSHSTLKKIWTSSIITRNLASCMFT